MLHTTAPPPRREEPGSRLWGSRWTRESPCSWSPDTTAPAWTARRDMQTRRRRRGRTAAWKPTITPAQVARDLAPALLHFFPSTQTQAHLRGNMPRVWWERHPNVGSKPDTGFPQHLLARTGFPLLLQGGQTQATEHPCPWAVCRSTSLDCASFCRR